ncbi:MAG: SPOR domain-containing protein [Leptospirales bacterium]|nr:SPOR domain-containing protein [Leptospirales bacterium]
MDLYSGHNNNVHKMPTFTVYESDFFDRVREKPPVEQDRFGKKASRIIFIIAALCIVTFTTGLVVGLKFAGGKNTPIVDEATSELISRGVSSVSNMINRDSGRAESYPVSEFPFLLRIGNSYSKDKATELANYAHTKGYVAKGSVIFLPKEKGNSGLYNIYVGPYKNEAEAKQSKQKFDTDSKFTASNNINIIKRS